MDIQKKEVTLNLPGPCMTVSAISDSDAIVNDSKPDLLKIISVDASSKVTKSEILNGRMMISGHISYKVLYQPENGEGVCSIHTGTDFSHMEENPGFSEGMYSDVSSRVEHIEPELINSRKIKLKSVVALDIKTENSISVLIPVSAEGDNLMVKTGDFTGYSRFLQKRDIISITDSLSIPAGKPAVGTILKTDLSLCNKDIKVISGKVIIKGEFAICTLYIPENGEGTECHRHALPFTEILDAEGVTEEHRCRVKTEIEESDFSLTTDSDGDVRIINASIRMGVRISADMPVSEKTVTDLYSLSDALDMQYKSLSLQMPVFGAEFDYNADGSISMPEQASSVYNITGHPVINSTAVGDGKITAEGYVEICAVGLSHNPVQPIIVHKDEIPFKIETSAENACANVIPDCNIEINNIIYNPGNAGNIDVRVTLCCKFSLFCDSKMEFVDRAESVGAHSSPAPSIVLYFVQKGDTLWDIAKRYHTKEEYISELNGESAKLLTPGSQLLIPRG